mmetsp:Transcript_7369/g.15656  ORF Transcript_7369/g.15656 Transcript_7369/m.15656 type:complete len:457 (-) Transcript_7369:123-1493(-)
MEWNALHDAKSPNPLQTLQGRGIDVLADLLLRKSHGLGANLPHLYRGRQIPDGVRLGVLEDLAARPASPPGLAVGGPPSDGLGAAVPGPVDVGLVALGVVDDLGEAVPGLLLVDVAAGDVLHEEGEQLAEPLPLLPEQSGLSDAPGVHGREDDAGGLVIPAVQLADGHHVADLGVLVRLGPEEGLAVGHGDGIASALLESLELAEVGLGVDEAASDGVGVAGDGPDDANPGILGLLHVVEKEVDKEEVAQVVHSHGHLEPIVGPGGLGVSGLVDGGVADEVVEGAGRLESLEVGDEVADGLEVAELELHGEVGALGEAAVLGHLLHLLHVPNRQDHEVPSRLRQGLRARRPQSGRRPGDHHQLPKSDLKPPQNLRHLLLLGDVKLLGQLRLGQHGRKAGGAGADRREVGLRHGHKGGSGRLGRGRGDRGGHEGRRHGGEGREEGDSADHRSGQTTR